MRMIPDLQYIGTLVIYLVVDNNYRVIFVLLLKYNITLKRWQKNTEITFAWLWACFVTVW